MKRMLSALLSVVALLLALAVTVLAGDKPLAKPDVLGEEEVFTSEKFVKYETFIVKDFSVEGAEIANMDDDEKAKLVEVKPIIVKTLTENIVKYVKEKTKFKTVESNTIAGGDAVILEGKFTKFNAGHGAAKFWLGWMAPESTKTNISVEGRLIDAKTGRELARFKDTRSGGEGSAMGFMARVFKIQAKDEGEEIAEFIAKLY